MIRDMVIENIFVYAAWQFIVFGLSVGMLGTMEVRAILQNDKRGAAAGVLFNTIFTAVLIGIGQMSGLYLVCINWVLNIRWWRREKGKETAFAPALRGLCCIVILIAAELVFGEFYYSHLEAAGMLEKVYNRKVMPVCLLLMSMSQYMWVLLLEFARMKDKSKRLLSGILMIKTFEEMYFLYILTEEPYLFWNPIVLESVFYAGQVIGYLALFVLPANLEQSHAIQKREEIHLNSYEYYLNMEEEHMKIRRLYHDMQNQLMVMEDLKGRGSAEVDQYINDTSELLKTMNRYYHTGQRALDIILFDAARRSKEKGIAFEAVVAENSLNFIGETDLCVIFSNAINNAIEACEKITEGPKKIQIKAGQNVNDVLIYFRNTVSKERQKGSLSTRKKNPIMHGIGMSSIAKAAEKYQGYLSIQERDSFQLTILFARGMEDAKENEA